MLSQVSRQKEEALDHSGPTPLLCSSFLNDKGGRLVVRARRDGFQPLLERGPYLLDAVQMRRLVVLLLLIVDLLAVYEYLQNAADPRGHRDSDVVASLGE